MTTSATISDKEVNERMARIQMASIAQLKHLIGSFGADWIHVVVEMYVRTVTNEFLNKDDAELQKHFKKIREEVKKALETIRDQLKKDSIQNNSKELKNDRKSPQGSTKPAR